MYNDTCPMNNSMDYMNRAIELAMQGLGHTSPNPAVGAVIVKNKKIIGEGYHKKAGTDHAEIVALKSVKNKKKLIGATLFVTMEPCCHTGKTPPCTDAIIESGITHVVYGMRDPFVAVRGLGSRALKKANIKVEFVATHTEEFKTITKLNQPFIKHSLSGLPYVTLKAGMSLDGKIATAGGESQWITGAEARKDARFERSLHDAVLVGSGTVRADNPELAAHTPFKKKKLLRVIIDSDLSLKTTHKVFRDKHVFVATTDAATKKNKAKFDKAGIEFKSFGKKRVSIKQLLKYLGTKSIQSVYVEGGAGVHGSFYDTALKHSELLDQVLLYIAPKLIGGESARSVIAGDGVGKLKDIPDFEQIHVGTIGTDLKIRGHLKTY